MRLPLVGALNHYAFLAGYGQTISALLTAGVSILDAHDIVEAMTHNHLIKKALLNTKQMIGEGVGIAMSMSGTPFFPRVMTKMVQVGEDSGSLPEVLNRTSAYYEKKVDMAVTSVVSILEPVMIVMVGGVILVILLALYLPLFQMSDVQG